MNLKGIICINAKMPWRLSENLVGKSRRVKIDGGKVILFSVFLDLIVPKLCFNLHCRKYAFTYSTLKVTND